MHLLCSLLDFFIVRMRLIAQIFDCLVSMATEAFATAQVQMWKLVRALWRQDLQIIFQSLITSLVSHPDGLDLKAHTLVPYEFYGQRQHHHHRRTLPFASSNSHARASSLSPTIANLVPQLVALVSRFWKSTRFSITCDLDYYHFPFSAALQQSAG